MLNKDKIEQFFVNDALGITGVLLIAASHFNIIWMICLSIPLIVICLVFAIYFLIKNKSSKPRLTKSIINIIMSIIMLVFAFLKLLW